MAGEASEGASHEKLASSTRVKRGGDINTEKKTTKNPRKTAKAFSTDRPAKKGARRRSWQRKKLTFFCFLVRGKKEKGGRFVLADHRGGKGCLKWLSIYIQNKKKKEKGSTSNKNFVTLAARKSRLLRKTRQAAVKKGDVSDREGGKEERRENLCRGVVFLWSQKEGGGCIDRGKKKKEGTTQKEKSRARTLLSESWWKGVALPRKGGEENTPQSPNKPRGKARSTISCLLEGETLRLKEKPQSLAGRKKVGSRDRCYRPRVIKHARGGKKRR